MRIAIFTDTYLPQINGVVISTHTLVQELESLGHEVVVIGPRTEQAKRSTKKVWRFRAISFPFQKEYMLVSPISKKLRRFRRMTFDVIHAQTPFSLGHLAQYIGWKYDIAVVHTYHTFWIEYAHYLPIVAKLPGRILRKLDNLLFSRSFCNRCNHIVAPSDQMKEKLTDYGVLPSITVLPTGIQLEKCKAGDIASFRDKWGIGKEDRVMVFVGRIALEKNVYFLMDCFEKVHKKEAGVKLLFIGDGPERINLKKCAKALGLQKDVIFTGYVDHEEVFTGCAASDIITFPSKTETQGLSLVEGMSQSKPAVCIDAMGVAHILKGDNGGFLTKDNLREYTEKVLLLLRNKEVYQEKAEQALKRARDFGSKAMAKRMITVYEKAIKAKQDRLKKGNKMSREMFFSGEFWKNFWKGKKYED